jgi:phosphoadenosine phosphosulfate reductase
MEENSMALREQLQEATAAEGLTIVAGRLGSEAIFSTSFGKEDQAITHLLAVNGLPIPIFTLDTGRLFPETHVLWNNTIKKYMVTIHPYYPAPETLREFITANGPNCFYESVEKRIQCCKIRKVEPLQIALKGKKLWITGIRAAQSTDRKLESKLEYDAVHSIYKYHPIIDWTDEQLDAFIKTNQVPVNSLHQQGFLSIGCAPCTRALKPGEEARAGRWWWEETTKKECGLHNRPNNINDIKK